MTSAGASTSSHDIAKYFGPAGSRGWWAWLVVTCSALTAHAVLLGFGAVWLAVVIVSIVMTAPLSAWIGHARAWAMLFGVYFAVCLLLLLEIYLGWSGLHYGPIGTAGRPFHSVDAAICWALLTLYRQSTLVKALVSPGLSILLYGLAVWAIPPGWVNGLAHFFAAVGTAATIFFWLPFTNDLDGKEVAFSKAVLDASGAKVTLGSYGEAVDRLRKEVDSLKRLVDALKTEPRPKPDPLLDAIREYAAKLAAARQRGEDRNRVLRRSPSRYDTHQDLAPLRPKPAPPSPDLVFTVRPGDLHGIDLTGLDIVDADAARRAAAALVSEGAGLQQERARLLQELRAFLGNQIKAALGDQWSQELADEIIIGLMQALLTAAPRGEAQALGQEADRLQAAVDQRVTANQTLSERVGQFEADALAVARADAACSDSIGAVETYLRSRDGLELLRLITNGANRDRAIQLLDPRALPGREISEPAPPDPELDTGAVQRTNAERLRNEGIGPPRFDWASLRQTMNSLPQGDGATNLILPLVQIACRRGQSKERIIEKLENARLALLPQPR